MKTKEWIAVVIVIIVIAVIVSLITANLTGGAIRFTKLVRANSCDADSVCDMINARVGEIIVDKGVKAVNVSAGVVIAPFMIANEVKSKPGEVLNVIAEFITATKGVSAILIEAATVNAKEIKLVGIGNETGNAYACIYPTGKIFRSLTACR